MMHMEILSGSGTVMSQDRSKNCIIVERVLISKFTKGDNVMFKKILLAALASVLVIVMAVPVAAAPVTSDDGILSIELPGAG